MTMTTKRKLLLVIGMMLALSIAAGSVVHYDAWQRAHTVHAQLFVPYGDVPEDPMLLEALLYDARVKLGDGALIQARNRFASAAAVAPDDPRGHYGFALASLQIQIEYAKWFPGPRLSYLCEYCIQHTTVRLFSSDRVATGLMTMD